MADLPKLGGRDFPAYFAAVHGHQPFPWQARLAERLATGEAWPEVLDLPTGTGKTAALDAAVFQLALEAGSAARRAALRIVYVVDRRTIVDQAAVHAERIARALATADSGVLSTVRARLASYSRNGVPLRVATLRGGIARSDDWARSPDQPLVAVSTVDQVGSRLLFRGYGVSDRMKPVHAGLLGNDALYLLDEVHLSEPFRQTLHAIATRYATWAEVELPHRLGVVAMSATPGAANAEAFGLDPDSDGRHPELERRLSASKPATLEKVKGAKLVPSIETAVERLLDQIGRAGATVAVVVNRVATARDARTRLETKLRGIEVQLVTGRMRPLDRARSERELFPRLRSGRERDPAAVPLVVVATQCIEAGADFDFDALVTECASLDALRQRFGRLNRLGRRRSSPAAILAREDSLRGDLVYGDSLGATWEWLEEQASRTPDGTVDFGIRALPVPANPTGLLAPRANAPVLLPAHLDSWVQTAPLPVPDPEVGLWLHGPQRTTADVQVVWRADLSADALTPDADDDAAEQLEGSSLAALEALPPAAGEAMQVPFAAVRSWLEGRPEPAIADVEGVADDGAIGRGREAAGSPRPRCAIAWLGEDSRIIAPQELRPGMTIVVPATYGGIAHGTWNPNCADPVQDVGELAVFEQRGRARLRLHPEVLTNWFGDQAGAPRPADHDVDPEAADEREHVTAWLNTVAAPADLGPVIAHLRHEVRRSPRRGLTIDTITAARLGPDGALVTFPYLLVGGSRRASDAAEVSSEDDRASFTGREIGLAAHLAGVRDHVTDFAARVGLPPKVVADVALAGWWHDAGKADPRFQRMLHGGSEFRACVAPEPLAKSAAVTQDQAARRLIRARSGYPEGARHEVMSLALLESAADALANHAADWDLVLHLVASHHGWCRPLAPCVVDPKPVTVEIEHAGITVTASSAHQLERLDSGIGERFWRLVRRYGWWRLAWLEAVLRLGDHRRSEAEQTGEAT
jgi:CRISPR-associated endonuclease/helicase Cas3